MTPEQQKAADEAAAAAAKKAEEDEAAKKAAEDEAAKASQDLLKQELERKQNRSGHTKLEKARHAEKKIQDEIAKLEAEEGVHADLDDDQPVTVGMLKERQKQDAVKTALNMAESEISDETERELVKHHLENSIRPTGNPAEDLRLARAIVNDTKNRQIAEEIERKKVAQRNGTGSGAPAKKEGDEFVPTAEEAAYMKPPFSLTKEAVLTARKQAEKTS
ncbi:MAG: hypothetical protein V4438_04205 [Patescibacteria group bacterium]